MAGPCGVRVDPGRAFKADCGSDYFYDLRTIMNDNAGRDELTIFFADSESTPWRASTFAAGVEVKDLGAANGRAMQLVRFPPGTVFPVHKHAGPEFVYILEGE